MRYSCNPLKFHAVLQSGLRVVSYTTSVLSVIYEWRNLLFNIDSDQQILMKLSIAILFSLRVFVRNIAEWKLAEKLFFSYFVFWTCLTWVLNMKRIGPISHIGKIQISKRIICQSRDC